jgi:hypothetical protein
MIINRLLCVSHGIYVKPNSKHCIPPPHPIPLLSISRAGFQACDGPVKLLMPTTRQLRIVYSVTVLEVQPSSVTRPESKLSQTVKSSHHQTACIP